MACSLPHTLPQYCQQVLILRALEFEVLGNCIQAADIQILLTCVALKQILSKTSKESHNKNEMNHNGAKHLIEEHIQTLYEDKFMFDPRCRVGRAGKQPNPLESSPGDLAVVSLKGSSSNADVIRNLPGCFPNSWELLSFVNLA
ncbi:hypothetical protein M9H77_28136 [Catharanthus roseus]|uniref:Uncharacterized protein n=1 Tax=Catharanthus roseus TaxID=4058 RepID=A0ACC0AH65_CATRO|nr:hypothetical protein M9H77_28136 [Catharanthus roseus]